MQGHLGTCYLLSALTVLAARPDLLDRVIITKEYNAEVTWHMFRCELQFCTTATVCMHVLIALGSLTKFCYGFITLINSSSSCDRHFQDEIEAFR